MRNTLERETGPQLTSHRTGGTVLRCMHEVFYLESMQFPLKQTFMHARPLDTLLTTLFCNPKALCF